MDAVRVLEITIQGSTDEKPNSSCADRNSSDVRAAKFAGVFSSDARSDY